MKTENYNSAELTNLQKMSLVQEIKEYKSIDDLIFLYEVGNVYKVGSFMNLLSINKVEFLKGLSTI